ncbi:GNAT family N-acetyltransferase [Magnetospira sp. QH-2]|uniref:GNAT family N-acetyltransferase n=1 Tax=Magnetospira sp. (strain QH-2) TaxID=1288970 RepID=UPI0003E80CF4|nr:GNAT family N-acetyltransferase [Magnetospira sp. QH-2]CCQ73332.1 Putative uncharacterized N-acetyltransferase C1271.07c [Magnetospira sp. QH-2]
MTERVIAPAVDQDDLGQVQTLFREYQQWLDVDLCFQGFEAELRGLPGKYAPPAGLILLARVDALVAGCVAFWPLDDQTCEMKRLYVRPPWRGKGLGREMAVRIVDAAREAGYERMVLDTLERLTEARMLYRSLGFRSVEAYYDNPLDGVVYMERRL